MGGAAQPPAPAAEQPRKQFMRFPFTPKNAQDDSPIVPKSLSELTTEVHSRPIGRPYHALPCNTIDNPIGH